MRYVLFICHLSIFVRRRSVLRVYRLASSGTAFYLGTEGFEPSHLSAKHFECCVSSGSTTPPNCAVCSALSPGTPRRDTIGWSAWPLRTISLLLSTPPGIRKREQTTLSQKRQSLLRTLPPARDEHTTLGGPPFRPCTPAVAFIIDPLCASPGLTCR